MKTIIKYVFGYGSLMNPKSLQKTLPGKTIHSKNIILGYRRKFNVPHDGHLYLNIIPFEDSTVEGVLIEVSDMEFEKIKRRESTAGYRCIDITNKIMNPSNGKVFAFMASEKDVPKITILESYIETCLKGVEKENQETWLSESIITNPIENDLENIKYENFSN